MLSERTFVACSGNSKTKREENGFPLGNGALVKGDAGGAYETEGHPESHWQKKNGGNRKIAWVFFGTCKIPRHAQKREKLNIRPTERWRGGKRKNPIHRFVVFARCMHANLQIFPCLRLNSVLLILASFRVWQRTTSLVRIGEGINGRCESGFSDFYFFVLSFFLFSPFLSFLSFFYVCSQPPSSFYRRQFELPNLSNQNLTHENSRSVTFPPPVPCRLY